MIMLEGGYRIGVSFPERWVLEKKYHEKYILIAEDNDLRYLIEIYLDCRKIEKFNKNGFKLTENDAKGVVHNTPKGKDFIESINRCLKDTEVME